MLLLQKKGGNLEKVSAILKSLTNFWSDEPKKLKLYRYCYPKRPGAAFIIAGCNKQREIKFFDEITKQNNKKETQYLHCDMPSKCPKIREHIL